MRFLPKQFQAIASEHKMIASGMLTVGGFLLAAKAIGLAKEMLVAWRYGVSELVDAYLLVFNLSQWPVAVLGGALVSSLIPLIARIRREKPEALELFRRELLGQLFVFGLLLALVGYWLLPWLFQQAWLDLTDSQQNMALEFNSYLIWLIPVALVARLAAAWLMEQTSHLNSLLEAMPALCIGGLVIFYSDAEPLIWGTVAGFVLQMGLLLWRSGRLDGLVKPALSLRSEYWKPFMLGSLLLVAGQAFMSAVAIADQFFAARMEAGAISTLGYSNRLLALLMGLGATTIGRAILPVLSRISSESSGKAYDFGRKWFWLLLGLGLAMGAAIYPVVSLLVELIFERGSFSANDSASVSEVIEFGLVQLPFYFASMVIFYALLSQRRHVAFVMLGLLGFVCKLIASAGFVSLWGLQGLMLATALTYFVICIAGYQCLHERASIEQ